MQFNVGEFIATNEEITRFLNFCSRFDIHPPLRQDFEPSARCSVKDCGLLAIVNSGHSNLCSEHNSGWELSLKQVGMDDDEIITVYEIREVYADKHTESRAWHDNADEACQHLVSIFGCETGSFNVTELNMTRRTFNILREPA